MVTNKTWFIINVALGMVSVLLIANLFGVEFPSVGKAQYYFNENEPLCVMKNWQGEFVERNIDRCCLEKETFALSCQKEEMLFENKNLNRVCSIGKIEYWFNSKAYSYCRIHPVS